MSQRSDCGRSPAGAALEDVRNHRTPFCSDPLRHFGDVAAVMERKVLGRVRDAVRVMQTGPRIGYMPYTCHTGPLMRRLANRHSRTPAVMHAPSYAGDCGKALCNLAGLLQEAFHTTTQRTRRAAARSWPNAIGLQCRYNREAD